MMLFTILWCGKQYCFGGGIVGGGLTCSQSYHIFTLLGRVSRLLPGWLYGENEGELLSKGLSLEDEEAAAVVY